MITVTPDSGVKSPGMWSTVMKMGSNVRHEHRKRREMHTIILNTLQIKHFTEPTNQKFKVH